MDRDDFRERLLEVMEKKHHWAWPAFTSGLVPRERLHAHFEQEYGTYVRDFPILIGHVYVRCPVAVVRRELAENLYEEETGGLSAGKPHPELFLRYPAGLGMDLARFDPVELLPAAATYRAFLDDAVQKRSWAVGAAVVTLFVEGTPFERGEIEEGAPKRPTPPLSEHPLVKHYGLPISALELTRVHRQVEGDHRRAAWQIMLDNVPGADREPVVSAMRQALELWLRYRDAVAEVCGLVRRSDGTPTLA